MATGSSLDDGIIDVFAVEQKLAEIAKGTVGFDWSVDPPVEKCIERTEVVVIDHPKTSKTSP
jgi:hypothetical protein